MTTPVSKTTRDQMAVRNAVDGTAIGAAVAAIKGAVIVDEAVRDVAEGVKVVAGKAKDVAVKIGKEAKDVAVQLKDAAVEAAGDLKDGIVDIAEAAKSDYYNPLTKKALDVLGTDGKLIAVKDPTRKFSAIPEVDKKTALKEKVQAGKDYIKAAKSGTKKVKAALKVYDNLASTYGDKASLKTGRIGYYLTKMGLEVLTGSLISRSKIGRVVQEGLATAMGGLFRLVVKVAEYALRIIPLIVAAAAIVVAGALPAIVAVPLYKMMVENEQMSKLVEKVGELTDQVARLNSAPEQVEAETPTVEAETPTVEAG